MKRICYRFIVIPHEHITILGDGQMALVLADALVARGLGSTQRSSIRMWGPLGDHAEALARTRESIRLAGFHLHESVRVTADEREALTDATLIVNAIPTQFMRSVWERIGDHVNANTPVVSVTKGIENDTLLLPTQVLHDVRGSHAQPICALSGPTIAAELARRMPAAMIAAADDPGLAQRVQQLFTVPWLRIYSHDDVIGAELAGAVKNVIALAAGMIDGLEAGDNAKSALLARGLAEIARLGAAMDARLDTFFGIAGVGDLATTCFSKFGRNRTCGERLGRGETLEQILQSSTSVVEGVPTTQSVHELANRKGVDMPIASAVHSILFEGLTPADAIQRLMSRETKVEQIG